MRLLFCTPLALLAACVGPSDNWGRTREVCGLVDADPMFYPYPGPPDGTAAYVAYDEACAVAMGDDLGVQWPSFSEAELPGAANGSALEKLLSGAFVLLAADFGSVDALLAMPAAPIGLVDELVRLRDELRWSGEEAAGGLLYNYVSARVVRTVPREDAYHFSLAPWSDTLYVPPLEPDQETSSYGMAATLVHEASHASGDRRHVDCATRRTTPQGGDADWEGAFAAEALMLEALYRHLPAEDTDNLRGRVQQEVAHTLAELCPDVLVPELQSVVSG